jgi:hypothetical protein
MKGKKYSKKNQEKLKAYLQNNKVDDSQSIRKNSPEPGGRPQDYKNNVERGSNGQTCGG